MKIGITGHQRLNDADAWNWVEAALCQELDLIAHPITAVTSLAIGADQLFASLVIRRGGTIHAVIPYAEYAFTFAPSRLKNYQELLSQAKSVEVLKSKGANEDAYLAAGKRVVELADFMFAVWNEKPAKGKGGTADVVAYAISKTLPLIIFNPVKHTITRK